MSRFVLVILAIVTLAGCLTSGEVVPVRRYTIEPAIQVTASETTSKTIGVRPFEAARPYREAMVYLDSGQELGRRSHEEWAERPREVLTRAAMDALITTKRFSDVGDASLMVRPDYILTGEVREFREDRTVTPWQGEVELRLVLREAFGVEQVWADTIRAAIPMEGQDASHAAAALSQAVSEVINRAAQGIAAATP